MRARMCCAFVHVEKTGIGDSDPLVGDYNHLVLLLNIHELNLVPIHLLSAPPPSMEDQAHGV